MGLIDKVISSHRKYVWNDFSIGLEKAKIKILQCADLVAEDFTKTNFELIKTLSVQVNPSSFKTNISISPKSILSALNAKDAGGHAVTIDPNTWFSECTIPLYYDIYDEFMARTGNEAYQSNGISLMDKDITSLPLLAQYSAESLYYVQFIWGDIEKFGMLKGLEIEYTAFSRWGQPLKANAELKIEERYVGDHKLKIIGDLTETIIEKGKKVAGNVVTGMTNIFR